MKLDDGLPANPKIEDLSDKAFRLYIYGLCHCGRKLTDGEISAKDRKVLMIEAGCTARHVAELERAGLWVAVNGHYSVNDFLDYNMSAAEIREERRAAAERMRSLRAKRAAERSGERSGERSSERGGERSIARSGSPSRPYKPRETSDEVSLASERRRDELWDALTDELGEVTTRTERGRRNAALRELRAAGATPDDIRERCSAYRARWPDIDLTANALVGNWSLLAKPAPRGKQSNLDRALALISPPERKEIEA